MFIFFEIPYILILVVLLGLLGVGMQIASTVVFWLFIVLFLFYWIVFLGGLITSMINSKNYIGMLLSVLICVAGFLSSIFFVKTFYRIENGIKTIILISIGLAILQAVILFLSLGFEKNIGKIVCCMATLGIAVLLCMWTIGYSISYPIKTGIKNVAYYECIEHKTKPGVMPYINRNIYDSYSKDVRNMPEENIIGSYSVGDRLQPAHEIKVIEAMAWEYVYSDRWFSVYTQDGQVGWIPDREVEVYYKRDSDYVTVKQAEKISQQWYGRLPMDILELCEDLFERFPMKYKCNFAE